MSARKRHASGGYTLIEVLAAMVILGAGILGIISMQAATVNANLRAHEITMASNVARRWNERLRRDSYQWSDPGTPLSASNTTFLRQIGTSGLNTWFIPTTIAATGTRPLESPAFDYWGNDVDMGATPENIYYCTHLRFQTLLRTGIIEDLIRAEVRVWWFREGGVRPSTYANCGSAGVVNTMGTDTTNVHWVYMAQAIRRHDR